MKQDLEAAIAAYIGRSPEQPFSVPGLRINLGKALEIRDALERYERDRQMARDALKQVLLTAVQSTTGQMTIGSMLQAIGEFRPELPVRFDFGLFPWSSSARRGGVAVLWNSDGWGPPSVAEFRAILHLCLTEPVDDKGNDRYLDENTPAWCGERFTCAIVGIIATDSEVIIQTAHMAPYAEKFYLRDTRQTPGGNALWWGPNRGGYTTLIEMAGVYSREEAERIIRGMSGEAEMVPADVVQRATRRTVDMDRLRNERSK